MSIIVTSQKNVDLSQGFYLRTVFESGELKISETSPGFYYTQGEYESPVLDLGERYREILKVSLLSIVPTGSRLEIYTATSLDGYNFSEYVLTSPDGAINSPQARYIKLKLVFKAGSEDTTRVVQDFAAEEAGQFEANGFVVFNGALQLKTLYREEMVQDTAWAGEGVLLKKVIDKTQYLHIKRMEVS